MRCIDKLLAAAAIAVTFAGCTDGPVSVNGGDGRILLAPQFSFNGPTAGQPITTVRLTSVLYPEGPQLGFNDVPVVPSEPAWTVYASLDLGGRDSAQVLVYIEMLSAAGGSELVEWSGSVGPVTVRARETTAVEDGEVALIRGPTDNRFVDAVFAYGPSSMYIGQTATAYAEVSTSGSDHQILWTSSDPAVVDVDAVGDSVTVSALSGGSATLVAAAGAHADTVVVYVDTVAPGGVAGVYVLPDSAVIVLGASRAFSAIAFDSMENPVAASFTWTSLEPAVASVTQSGAVTALALGRARIVAGEGEFADTAIVDVQELPPGVDLLWQGGTPGAEQDWFTADNWSPAQVPGASSVIYLPAGAIPIFLSGNAEVGGILSEPGGGYWFDIGTATLTSYGDVIVSGTMYGDSASRLVIDAPSARIGGYLPPLTIRGNASLAAGVYAYGDIRVDGSVRSASLDVGDSLYVQADGDMTLIQSHVTIGENALTGSAGLVYIGGDLSIDGGDSRNRMTGGDFVVGGDVVVSAASCNALAPSGTIFYLQSDTSRIDIGCPGPAANHFADLDVYSASATERLLYLDSDVVVLGDLYMSAPGWLRVVGNATTLFASRGDLYLTELDHVFLELGTADANQTFYTDSVRFTGMAGETRAQLVYRHPGSTCDCSYWHDIEFDAASSGPYVEAIDSDSVPYYLQLYMEKNPGDGPQRVVTSGGAQVYWAGVPFNLFYWSGDVQTGPQNQPLLDSLVVQVLDFGYYPVIGASVDWTVTAGNGSVSPAVSTTDADGLAATQYTVGDTMQAWHEVAATMAALPGDTILFTAVPTASAGGVTARSVGAAPRSVRAEQSQPRVIRDGARQHSRPEIPAPPARPAARAHSGDRR